jgi:hypothetical protein
MAYSDGNLRGISIKDTSLRLERKIILGNIQIDIMKFWDHQTNL